MKIKNKTIIGSLIMLFISINLVSAGFYYNVSIKYDDGKINIKNVDVIFSQKDLSSLQGDYYLELRQDQDNLESYKFKVPKTIVYDNADESGKINGGGVITLNESDFEVFIPYTESADAIVITDSNKVELAKKDISYLSKNIVNNQVTKQFEANPVKPEKILSEKSTTASYLIIGIIILIILAVLTIIVLISKKQPSKLKKR